MFKVKHFKQILKYLISQGMSVEEVNEMNIGMEIIDENGEEIVVSPSIKSTGVYIVEYDEDNTKEKTIVFREFDDDFDEDDIFLTDFTLN